jgi:hypothetical protein
MKRNVQEGVRWFGWAMLTLALVLSSGLLVGCSSNKTASVSGKVTFKGGQAVTGGILTFSPIVGEGSEGSGKPATGEVKSDGSYVLGTYGTADGAVIGRHKVIYSPPTELPEGKTLKPGEVLRTPFNGLVPKQNEVEVKAGSNTIDIELVPPGGRK